MLGVATMIVVNAVMAGFAEKMRDRLHGVLADVVVESYDINGFTGVDEVMARIEQVAGDRVAAMAPTLETFGILTFVIPNGQTSARQVQIIGVRPEERAKTGDFAEFLIDDQMIDGKPRRIAPSFEVGPHLRRHSPAGALLEETPEDDPFHDVLAAQAKDQVPDRGAILGYALATYHRGKDAPDYYIAPPGSKVILTFPSAGRQPKPVH